jgi:hypothetical protein
VSDPVLHVTNHSTREIFIDRDPNWDDQILLLDGRRLNRAHCLGPEQSATVSLPKGGESEGNEHMMGVIVADGRDYDYGSAGAFQMSIGQNPETRLLAVTDEYTIKRPAIQYAATGQQAWSMNIEFIDAPSAQPATPRGAAY